MKKPVRNLHRLFGLYPTFVAVGSTRSRSFVPIAIAASEPFYLLMVVERLSFVYASGNNLVSLGKKLLLVFV